MPCNDKIRSHVANLPDYPLQEVATLACYLQRFLEQRLQAPLMYYHLIVGSVFYDGRTVADDLADIAEEAQRHIEHWPDVAKDVDVQAEVMKASADYIDFLKSTQVTNRFGGSFGSAYDVALAGVSLEVLAAQAAANDGIIPSTAAPAKAKTPQAKKKTRQK